MLFNIIKLSQCISSKRLFKINKVCLNRTPRCHPHNIKPIGPLLNVAFGFELNMLYEFWIHRDSWRSGFIGRLYYNPRDL